MKKQKIKDVPVVTKFRSPNFCVKKIKTKAFPFRHIKGLLSLYSKGREYNYHELRECHHTLVLTEPCEIIYIYISEQLPLRLLVWSLNQSPSKKKSITNP